MGPCSGPRFQLDMIHPLPSSSRSVRASSHLPSLHVSATVTATCPRSAHQAAKAHLLGWVVNSSQLETRLPACSHTQHMSSNK